MSDEPRFPILGEEITVSWSLAEDAYEAYVAEFGHRQSLERIAERGGFSRKELVHLLGAPCETAKCECHALVEAER